MVWMMPGEGEAVGVGDLVALADMIGNIINDGSEGSQFLGILIADPDTKFLFNGH